MADVGKNCFPVYILFSLQLMQKTRYERYCNNESVFHLDTLVQLVLLPLSIGCLRQSLCLVLCCFSSQHLPLRRLPSFSTFLVILASLSSPIRCTCSVFLIVSPTNFLCRFQSYGYLWGSCPAYLWIVPPAEVYVPLNL